MRRYPEYKESGVEWIREIPAHWEIGKIKHIVTFVSEKSTPETNAIKISPENVESETGKVLDFYSSYDSGGVKFQAGDVLFNKLRVYLSKVVFAEYSGYSLGEMIVIRPSLQDTGKYLFYLMLSCRFIEYCNSISEGAKMPRTAVDDILNAQIPLTSYQERTQIANFLDHKTKQIDELTRIKEQNIELLHEQRTALINQAVTKGLDPNVEMKPSGVEWIGKIPKDWSAVPLTKYLESIIDYRGRTPEKTEDGRFLVTAKNVRDGQIDYEISQEFTSEDEYQRIMTRGMPQIGDVLLTTEAPLGEVANVDDVSIALAQRIIKFRPKSDRLNPYFLKYWILSYSFQSELRQYATGSTAQGIKASKLCLLKLNLPPLKEQIQIANFLDRKTERIDELISTEQRKIELLKDYRQSLISEVVTGKIDVRSEL